MAPSAVNTAAPTWNWLYGQYAIFFASWHFKTSSFTLSANKPHKKLNRSDPWAQIKEIMIRNRTFCAWRSQTENRDEWDLPAIVGKARSPTDGLDWVALWWRKYFHSSCLFKDVENRAACLKLRRGGWFVYLHVIGWWDASVTDHIVSREKTRTARWSWSLFFYFIFYCNFNITCNEVLLQGIWCF